MIKRITIRNFKLYRQNTFFDELKAINVLTGINGRGKSTLLHAILLPAQSILESQWNDKLVLNGQYVELGNAVDVRNEENSRTQPIEFEFECGDGILSLKFDADSDTAQKLPLKNVNGHAHSEGQKLRNFLLDSETSIEMKNLIPGVAYIAAERRGPKLNYQPAPEHGLMDAMGEYAPSLLSLHKDDTFETEVLSGITDIFPEIGVEDMVDKSMGGIVNFWLTQMFGFTEVEARYVEEANVYVLLFRTSEKGKYSKPTNVGFGYSYVLPILVAGLTLKRGDTLLLENPEAHLHPKAQSILGKFLAWIAIYRDVQLFVETHSEHIVNSFRVLLAQEVIAPEHLNVLFFDDHYEQYAVRIEVDEKGHIVDWPKYFFDQEERDLDIII